MRNHASSSHGSTRNRLDLALSRELEADEKVIWRGMQLARIDPKAFAIYLFAVPWTAFALFWTAMAFAGVSGAGEDTGAGLLAYAFPLFGTPFIAVGVGMLAFPFLPLWERGKVLYAITNKRILKLRLGRELSVKAVPRERVGAIERNEVRDGSGSIKLPVSIGRDSDGDKTTEHFELGLVADVMGAHRAISHFTGVPL
ncbi:hypothetical protein [Erythrobacter sp. YT30]|uniref:hypothetical protein n=1 Tax=Erythrobacter sp. YT30 TaxID=1735012 RepID=UPI00076C0D5E|nr:hypothetical protein [Erythrobacter sp. YT30]KWV90819.1 hypothetical protein AUC45_05585 [Erythrobacter sp. YT30]